MLNADRDSLAVTYLDLAVSAISSSNAVTAVNRRANGTPYRRAKGTPLRDGAGLIGHAPLRCARQLADFGGGERAVDRLAFVAQAPAVPSPIRGQDRGKPPALRPSKAASGERKSVGEG